MPGTQQELKNEEEEDLMECCGKITSLEGGKKGLGGGAIRVENNDYFPLPKFRTIRVSSHAHNDEP